MEQILAHSRTNLKASPGATARSVIGHNRALGEKNCAGRVFGFYACGILRDAGRTEGDCVTGAGAQPEALVWFEKVS